MTPLPSAEHGSASHSDSAKVSTLRDIRLFATIVAISVLAVLIAGFSVRRAEDTLLQREVIGVSQRWAAFLEVNMVDLDGLLERGVVDGEDLKLLDHTSLSSGVQQFEILNRAGESRYRSWTQSSDGAPSAAMLEVLRSGEPFAFLRRTADGGQLVGQAYIPIAGATRSGAIRAYLDMTARFATLRRTGNIALLGLTVLLLTIAGLCSFLVRRNMAERDQKLGSLQSSQARLVQAEAALREEKALLSLLQAVTKSANEAHDPRSALGATVEMVCAYTGWEVGHAWMYDGAQEVLVSSGVWHLKDPARHRRFREVSEQVRLGRGDGLPGQVLETARARWSADVRAEYSGSPRAAAGDLEVRAGFAFPVVSEGAAVAVLEFFATESLPPDEKILDLMAGVGAQLGRVMERDRQEARMRGALADADTANRAKSEFLAMMSHELRTPLNAIIGFSDIIRSATFGPVGNSRYQSYAEDINASGQHLLDLINDILDLSKIESGKEALHEEALSLAHLAASVRTLVASQAAAGSVTLTFAIDDDLAPIRADQRKLKQVLLNLLSNAIKFTPEGGQVTMHITADAETGGHTIIVEDTGIGIAEGDIERVMAPFMQVESRLARRYEGTGLGLPLAVSLVALHGGTLRLTSTLGEGTRVTVRLPADRVVDTAKGSAAVA